MKVHKYIFLFIQLVLYGIFLTLDILGRCVFLSNNIKFIVVVLCFLYVIFGRHKNRSSEHIYLIFGLGFTLVSDILILLSGYYFYGILTFIIAQQFYGMRITEFYNKARIISRPMFNDVFKRLLYQGAFGVLVIIMLLPMDVNINSLLLVSVFYFISLSTNVVRSLKLSRHFRDSRNIRFFAIGMVLFLLCDINVGLFNMSSFLSVGSEYQIIYNISSMLMWTFYGPSQVLIALSGDLPDKYHKKI